MTFFKHITITAQLSGTKDLIKWSSANEQQTIADHIEETSGNPNAIGSDDDVHIRLHHKPKGG